MSLPVASYRLQIQPRFPLGAASAWAAYGRELGITHLYASPLLAALPGSAHGYDVCDPTRVNPELGGEAGFAALAQRLRECGLGLVLDIVPNHMAADPLNPYWRDLLELGPASPYADWFDIDWTGERPAGQSPAANATAAADASGPAGKIILPVLDETAAQALERGGFALRFAQGEFRAAYDTQIFPLGLSSLPYLLRTPAPPPLAGLIGHVRRLAARLRPAGAWDASRAHELRLDFADLKLRLARLAEEAPLREWLAAHLAWWNRPQEGGADLPRRRAWLRLLASQPWRLLAWRGAGRRVNYRRFFALNHLVGVRQELPAVFEATHARILAWLDAGELDGLRIDHVDGLFDPAAYLNRLQRAGRPHAAPPASLVVEKILARDETLPAEWPVDGTSGYDTLNLLNDLFLDPGGMTRLGEIYDRFIHRRRDFAAVARARQRDVIESHFAGELKRLANALLPLAARRGYALAPRALERALRELTIALPAYRSYRADLLPGERDRELWERAWHAAETQWRSAPPPAAVLDYLRRLLLPEAGATDEAAMPNRAELLSLQRWQQWTGAVKAKGIEDTAFYTYNRLLSQNEVGGEPACDGLSAGEFHALIGARARRWPHSWNAATTHDTKRSEDARLRLNQLSEMPEEWERRTRRWRRFNRPLKPIPARTPLPGPNLEYYFYQTLVAAWPAQAFDRREFRERIGAHMLKAARELKGRTRWNRPDAVFEQALDEFVGRALTEETASPFLDDFAEFHARLAPPAAAASLAQLALRFALPGSPDIYQGAELWDLRLVDPDNRTPVDFDLRRRWLAEIADAARSHLDAALEDWKADWASGKIKLFLTWRALQFRRRHAELCLDGDYLPLPCQPEAAMPPAAALKIAPRPASTAAPPDTPAAMPACAFARRRGVEWLIAAAPLRFYPSCSRGFWNLAADAAPLRLRLPGDAPLRWRHCFTGELVSARRDASGAYLDAASLWQRLPAAWLEPAA